MGSGTDFHAKVDAIENSYLRDAHGVERLLRSYYTMQEKSRYQFDQSASTLIIDLEASLDKDFFTPLERQSLALIFFAELDMRQVARMLGVKTYEVIDSIADAIEKIAAVLMGYRVGNLPKYQPEEHSLESWLESVGRGESAIYRMPKGVNTCLLEALAAGGDELAVETLRQRVEGVIKEEPKPYSPHDYPCYTDLQFKNMDRNLNVSFLSKKEMDKIARGRTVVGSRKTAFYDDEFDYDTRKGKYGPRVVKAKIYI